MPDHNIDNFTSQNTTDNSSNNYAVDKNIILGLICLADVMCVDVSVLILTRCLNPCSFVSKNIWKMRIKFAKIPPDLLIMGCWVRGEGGGGEGIKNSAIIWSPPLTKYSVILARHPRTHRGLVSCHNDREHPPPHICHTVTSLLSSNLQCSTFSLSALLYLALKYIFGYLDICSVEV